MTSGAVQKGPTWNKPVIWESLLVSFQQLSETFWKYNLKHTSENWLLPFLLIAKAVQARKLEIRAARYDCAVCAQQEVSQNTSTLLCQGLGLRMYRTMSAWQEYLLLTYN